MRVNVVIPCFNAASFIGEAIESALKQTYFATSIIVVDDGSTDATPDIVARFGRRVALLRQRNLGPSAARNLALDVSNSDYIAFLDADDRWHPDKIACQVRFLRQHEECGAVHTGVRYIDAAGAAVDRHDNAHHRPRTQGRCLQTLLARNAITTSSLLVRRDVLGTDRFPVGLHAAEDWDLWLRLMERTRLGYLASPLTDYRVHDRNTSRAAEKMLRGRLTVLERALERTIRGRDRRVALQHRRRVCAALGHLAYERGEIHSARRLFEQALPSLDHVGTVRYLASVVPSCVRRPARQVWSRLRSAAAL
jgi:glycosyltransferase involved in cell wall biosynthesis